jgi:hypothetical protein
MSQLQRLGRNFDDGVTMHLHLENLRALIAVFHPDFYRFICSSDIVSMFFAYRWLLLDFKREFSFKDTLVLWETLWAQFATNHAALFVALAVVEVYGLPVMAKPRSSDYVLEYFNGLALHMDLHVVLRTMRAVCIAFFCIVPVTTKVLCRLVLVSPADRGIGNTRTSGGEEAAELHGRRCCL